MLGPDNVVDNDEPEANRTVLSAMWQHRVLVAIIVLAAVLVGLLYASRETDVFVATASLAVEDPRSSSLFEAGTGQRPERYLENQVQILRSNLVAERASALLEVSDPVVLISAEDISDSLSVGSSSSSDLITVTVVSENAATALATANAVITAYQEVRREEAVLNFSAAIEQLDQSMLAISSELERIQERVDAERLADPSRQQLEVQYQDALRELVRLQLLGTLASPEDRTAIEFQLSSMAQVLNIDAQDPNLAAVIAERDDATQRLFILAARRDELTVDAELAGAGVLLVSDATDAYLAPSNLSRTLAVALVLGLILGGGVSYLLALQRRKFANRTEPESVLGAPLLGSVPHYLSEGIESQLVVSSQPDSTAAEAYRFVVAGIDARLWQADSDSGGRSITFVSAVPGDGKTTTVANTGLAAAQKGGRVLLIDADFGSQDLADLFIPPTRLHLGITEVVAGEQPLHKAVYDVPDAPGLHVLARGVMRVTAPDFFASPAAQRLLREIRSKYDLVLIDTPPLLQVAYTTTLLQASTQAVVVVPHRSSIALTEELSERLQMIGTPLAGYIYNAAPLRRDLPTHGGSLADILGTGAPAGDATPADSTTRT
jgi:Mrp family chromosome partitioning ATPase/uncharacterized protein involved in exopolysaccharide biosynthesis